MARNNMGHMALYEAVNHDKFKAAQDKELERTVALKEAADEPYAQPVPQRKNAWLAKPRPFQIHNGTVEAYVPYPIAITVLIALVFVLVVAFALGRWSGKRAVASTTAAESKKQAEIMAKTAEVAKTMAQISATPPPAIQSITPSVVASAAAASGEYVIVIKQLSEQRNLEPVKKYFDEHGIGTEIKNIAGSYYLVTKNRFDSVKKGTEGAQMLEKIKNVGSRYLSPPGYGSFAPKMFTDAYGKKM
jgi:hypothetical protein